jgi:hypothetical protein
MLPLKNIKGELSMEFEFLIPNIIESLYVAMVMKEMHACM